MINKDRSAVYTGNNDDSIIVDTTDEAISIWDQVENMMAAEITVGEVKALRDEIERLRSLITAWADADDACFAIGSDQWYDLKDARVALRRAVGR